MRKTALRAQRGDAVSAVRVIALRNSKPGRTKMLAFAIAGLGTEVGFLLVNCPFSGHPQTHVDILEFRGALDRSVEF